jgi:PAS domain S-box-containing protein
MADDVLSGADELTRLRAENWRLKHELAEERDRFQHTFDNDLAGLLVSSFELNRFLEVNQRYSDFVGYTREEILATDPYQFWLATGVPEDLKREQRELERVVAGEISSYRIQKRHVTKSGAVRWGELNFQTVRDQRGRIRYSVLTCVDIHEQKSATEASDKLQASLLQAQKLETVGRLVGGVAHDFNNRLLVIIGHADLLRRACAHDAALVSHAEVVVSSARRAGELTRQLLAYSRKQVQNSRPLDLNGITEGARRVLERVVAEDIELVTELGAQSLVLADAGQLEQVLLNLALNARDAMPNGGRLTLRTFDVHVSAESPVEGLAPGPYVALAVSDTGTGISESARQHVFEPFFTTKEPGQGTGLGLASVDGVVRQSGGIVTLQTALDEGSTFTVYLPAAGDRDVLTTADASKPDYVPCAPVLDTIMVVDDEDDVRALLVEVLRLGAYRVLDARNAEQALELAGAHGEPIGLLVTDIVMPRIGGMELADRLRATSPELKVLFMSGHAERSRLRDLRENEQFIVKPFLPDDLFRHVSDFLGGTS